MGINKKEELLEQLLNRTVAAFKGGGLVRFTSNEMDRIPWLGAVYFFLR
jgi:hypothetical protein